MTKGDWVLWFGDVLVTTEAESVCESLLVIDLLVATIVANNPNKVTCSGKVKMLSTLVIWFSPLPHIPNHKLLPFRLCLYHIHYGMQGTLN